MTLEEAKDKAAEQYGFSGWWSMKQILKKEGKFEREFEDIFETAAMLYQSSNEVVPTPKDLPPPPPFKADDVLRIKDGINAATLMIDKIISEVEVMMTAKDDRIAELEKIIKKQAVEITQLRDSLRDL